MGFFDDLAETVFSKAPDGSEIYYPYGYFGKGRVVRDSLRRQKLFNYNKRVSKYCIPLIVVLGAASGPKIAYLVLVGVVVAGLFARQRYLMAGLPVYSEKRPRFTEFVARRAKVFPPWVAWVLGASSLSLVLGGLAMPILLHTSHEKLAFAVIGLTSWGVLGLALSVYLYKARKSNNSAQPTRESPD